MSSFTESVEKVITQLLPIMLLGNIVPAYIIPFIVLAPSLLNMVIIMMSPYFSLSEDHKITIYETNTHGSFNVFYPYVSYVLEKHGLIDKIKKQQCRGRRRN